MAVAVAVAVAVVVAVITMIVITITIILWKPAIRRSMYPTSVYLVIEIRDILYGIGICVYIYNCVCVSMYTHTDMLIDN